MGAYRRILAPVDGSKTSNKGLHEAIRLAKSEGAKLFVLHVVSEYPAFAVMDGMMAGAPGADLLPALREGGKRALEKARALAAKSAVPASIILREMLAVPAADPIVREARKIGADLIVMGTHGHRGVRRLVMGSDAEQVVRMTPVPVLLVRG
jgi:nucleotide-binding universal stress UspA family protein